MKDDFRAWVEKQLSKKSSDAVKETLFRQKYAEHGVGEIDYIIREKRMRLLIVALISLVVVAAVFVINRPIEQVPFFSGGGFLVNASPELISSSTTQQYLSGSLVKLSGSEAVLSAGLAGISVDLSAADTTFYLFAGSERQEASRRDIQLNEPVSVAILTDHRAGTQTIEITQVAR